MDALLVVSPTAPMSCGAGALAADLPAAVGDGHRVLVVTDPGVRAAGLVDRVLDLLPGRSVEVFDAVEPNPSTDTVAAAAERVRVVDPAAVVAVGGGSALDVAKAALAGAAAKPPLVAVPTTAGTGAETNGFGVFEDRAGRRKVYLGDPATAPTRVILDPELTLGLPPGPTAATGFDALIHAIESLLSRGRNPVSAAYARAALRLIQPALPVAVTDGGDLAARADLLLGAHLAGRALTLSGLGLIHGLAHAITARTGAAHGVALAAVADRVLEYARPACAEEYAEIAAELSVPAASLPEAVGVLAERVGAYRSLAELGVIGGLLPVVAETALADAVTANTPRRPTQAELVGLLG